MRKTIKCHLFEDNKQLNQDISTDIIDDNRNATEAYVSKFLICVFFIFILIVGYGLTETKDISSKELSQPVVDAAVINPFDSVLAGVEFLPHSMTIGKTSLGTPPPITITNDKIDLGGKVFNIEAINKEAIDIPNSVGYTVVSQSMETNEETIIPVRIYENKKLAIGLGKIALLYNIEKGE